RDLLAGRKPLVLRDEIYAVWAMMAGAVIGMGWIHRSGQLLALFVIVILFRMLSVHYKWRLPRRSLKYALSESVHAPGGHQSAEDKAIAAFSVHEEKALTHKGAGER
ncbi:trimeric intracellular cation channel family protein, partial [Paenibacillus darwinianus]